MRSVTTTTDDRFGVKKTQGIGYLGTDVRVVDDDGEDVAADARRSARSSSAAIR